MAPAQELGWARHFLRMTLILSWMVRSEQPNWSAISLVEKFAIFN
jgi:hypothetical protein